MTFPEERKERERGNKKRRSIKWHYLESSFIVYLIKQHVVNVRIQTGERKWYHRIPCSFLVSIQQYQSSIICLMRHKLELSLLLLIYSCNQLFHHQFPLLCYSEVQPSIQHSEESEREDACTVRSPTTNTGNGCRIITVSSSFSLHFIIIVVVFFFLIQVARVLEKDLGKATGDFCCIQMRDNEEKREEEKSRVMPVTIFSFPQHNDRLSKIIICSNDRPTFLSIEFSFYLGFSLYTTNNQDN